MVSTSSRFSKRRSNGLKHVLVFLTFAACTFYLLKAIESYSKYSGEENEDLGRVEYEYIEDGKDETTRMEKLEASVNEKDSNTIVVKGRVVRTRDKYRTLMDIMTSKSESEPDLPNEDIDPSECTQESLGKFYNANDRLIKEVERRIKEKDKGFAWVRWGDAEMIASKKDGQRESAMQRAVRVLASKTKSPEIVMNVGGHWLCKKNLMESWNKGLTTPMRVESSSPASSSETRKRDLDVNDIANDIAIHSFFYLPLGDITDESLNEWRKKKIEGWSGLIRKYNRPVVLIGPNHVNKIPFIKHDVWIDSTNIQRNNNKTKSLIRKVALEGAQLSRNHNNEPPVVILCAGLAAKTLIAVLRPLINKGWQFIDVGTQLDGFGGKKSRDYIDIAKMCKRAFEYRSEMPSDANAGTPHDIGGLDAINNYWFAPNVCDTHIKKMLADNNNNNNKVAPVSRSDARYPRGDEPQRKPAAGNVPRAKRAFARQEQEHEHEQEQQHKRQHYHQGHPFMQKRFSHAARGGSSSSSSSSKW